MTDATEFKYGKRLLTTRARPYILPVTKSAPLADLSQKLKPGSKVAIAQLFHHLAGISCPVDD